MIDALKTAKPGDRQTRGRRKSHLSQARDILMKAARECSGREGLPARLNLVFAIGLIEKAAEEAQQALS